MLTSALHVNQYGHGDDLVLLHGWGMHSGVWQPLISLLSQHYRITCIDLPGHGHSEFPETIPSLDAVLAAIIAVAPPQAMWCGWSLGGLLVQRLAYVYPERVGKVCCIASTPYFVKEGQWPGLTMVTLQTFAAQLENNYQQTVQRFIALQCLGLADERQQQRQLQTYLASAPAPALLGLTSALTWLTTLDCRELLNKISQPLYYIFGRLDALVPVAVAQHILQYQPCAQYQVMAKASHMPFISHTDECARLLIDYLQ